MVTFTEEILNGKLRFLCSDIFFARKVTQSVNLHNQINVDMRKVTSDKLTTCMLDTVICKLEWKVFFRQTFIDGPLGKTKYYPF